jgi:hypothetical protein
MTPAERSGSIATVRSKFLLFIIVIPQYANSRSTRFAFDRTGHSVQAAAPRVTCCFGADAA